MPDLPNEIWLEIIHDLGRPRHPSAYQLGSGCSRALAALCLLNRTFQDAAEPLLYSTPYITPGTLAAFTRTIISAEADMGDPLRLLPSKKGRLVKQLAIINFDKELGIRQIIYMACTLYALRPVIARLFFDVNMPHRDWTHPICDSGFASIRDAMQGMSSLEELYISEGFKTWPGIRWTSPWPRLRRLALSRSGGHPAIIDTVDWIYSLQTCIVYPDLEGALVACGDLAGYYLSGGRLQEMVVALPMKQAENYAVVMSHWEQMTNHPGRDAAIEVMKQRLKVIELPETSSVAFECFRERAAHFRAAVMDGHIWDILGTPWGEYINVGPLE
ncbi:hypothetical protein FRB96_008472 [Tulasnella sp. 330]|nr:hypothetical protein FRB96_008472 [Tulasnella sp. 330]KAG8883994.1 hypothetical protein FRB97_005438 [Tulasnella sp. 331]KAG8889319.1 hypothetical protein FRB98_004936 [Tulasnella sp. 332]